MNLQELLEALIDAAIRIGAEKVMLSRFDVAATSPRLRKEACDDPFIDRIYPALRSGIEIETPVFYATDAVAPGWAVFIAGGSVNLKDLSAWVKPEESDV